MEHYKLPEIDPYIIRMGELGVTYYSLSYVIGVLFGWKFSQFIIKKMKLQISEERISDYVSYLIISMILGGRLGYVIFYNPSKYLQNPIDIFKTYKGGMSFHGGLIGIIIGTYIFIKKYKINFFKFTDIISISAPIGIFFGRLANFINAELYGRESDIYWAIIFHTDIHQIPRHPSQIYEALLEGLLPFIILVYFSIIHNWINIKYRISGLFLLLYSIGRFISEIFREPDSHIGFLAFGLTMGQLLTIPIFAIGLFLLFKSKISNKKK